MRPGELLLRIFIFGILISAELKPSQVFASSFEHSTGNLKGGGYIHSVVDHDMTAVMMSNRLGEVISIQDKDKNPVRVILRTKTDRLEFRRIGSASYFDEVVHVMYQGDSAIEARFRYRNGSYQLVQFEGYPAFDFRGLVRAEARDENPIPCKETSAQAVQRGASGSVNATFQENVESRWISQSCESRKDEISRSIVGLTVSQPRTNRYFQCVSDVPGFKEDVGLLFLALSAPTTQIRVTCSAVDRSSYNDSTRTIDLGRDTSAEALNQTLFHELMHSMNFKSHDVINALVECCGGPNTNPNLCANLRQFDEKLGRMQTEGAPSRLLARLREMMSPASERVRAAELVTSELLVSHAGSLSTAFGLCRQLKLSADLCSGPWVQKAAAREASGQSAVVTRTKIVVPQSRTVEVDQPITKPIIPERLTVTTGDVSNLRVVESRLASYQSTGATIVSVARDNYQRLQPNLVSTAVAAPSLSSVRRASQIRAAGSPLISGRTQSRSATDSRARYIVPYTTVSSSVERVEADRTILNVNGRLVSMTLPYAEKSGFGEPRVEEYEAARSAPGLRAPPAEIRVSRPQVPRDEIQRTTGVSDTPETGGNSGGGSTGAGLDSTSGVGSNAALPTGRGPAGGDETEVENRWTQVLNTVSDVRSQFQMQEPEVLLRDPKFMSRLQALKIRVIFQGRRYSAPGFLTTINLDAPGARGAQ